MNFVKSVLRADLMSLRLSAMQRMKKDKYK